MPTTKTAKANPTKTSPAKTSPAKTGTVTGRPARTGSAKPGDGRESRPATRPDTAAATGTANPTAAGGSGGKPSRPSPAAGRAQVRAVPLTDLTAPVPPLPAAVADTPAARALWATLHTHPDATAADLAATARIGRSTATSLLASLAAGGAATRTPGGGTGRTRRPDRWAPTPVPAPAPASAPTPAPVPAVAGGVDAVDAGASGPAGAVPPGGKLAGGQLRDLVAAHLRAHPDQDFGPAAIAKHLDRSAGAVANACVRLIVLGQVTQTSHSPRRYRAATTG